MPKQRRLAHFHRPVNVNAVRNAPFAGSAAFGRFLPIQLAPSIALLASRPLFGADLLCGCFHKITVRLTKPLGRRTTAAGRTCWLPWPRRRTHLGIPDSVLTVRGVSPPVSGSAICRASSPRRRQPTKRPSVPQKAAFLIVLESVLWSFGFSFSGLLRPLNLIVVQHKQTPPSLG